MFMFMLIFHSTKPWGECCDLVDYEPAKLYGRLTATDRTRLALQTEGKVLEDSLDSTRVRYPKDIPVDFQPKTQKGLKAGVDQGLEQPSAVSSEGVDSAVVGLQSSVLEEASSSVAEVEGDREAAEYKKSLVGYDFPFCCQSSWASHSFKLWPGEYILSVYVQESHRVQKHVEKGIKVSRKKKTAKDPAERERTGDTPRETFVEMDLNDQGAWAHLSSVGSYALNSVTAEEMQESQRLLEHTCLSEMQRKGLPLPFMGPFMSDQQHEAGSRGMMEVVARARAQADELNVQLLELVHGKVISVLMEPP